MGRRARLDAELVRRGLARSRDHAAELVAQRRVRIGGVTATKPATGVDADTPLLVRVEDNEPRWASRGARKLLGALDGLIAGGPAVTGRRCLDAGASTGGFTDVLLHRGAREVVAVDVGYGQLAWSLRTDQRVRVHDRTNVRTLQPEDIGGTVDLTVADLSFISLRLTLPALIACTNADGDLLPMVKPQFEVGRERLGTGGVVRDPQLRAQAMLDVLAVAEDLGLYLVDAIASPLPGPSGNVEYFLWLRRGVAGPLRPIEELVDAAVRRGPQ
jgi:23S rRNA (cytidine1920-2'-O)/16S rRNA (cytidine1409-2'-O)-methyltransferase